MIFGSKQQWPSGISIIGLNGTNGFIISGANLLFKLKRIALSGAGDVNEDGINDILIGLSDEIQTGQSYVIFGCCAQNPPTLPSGNTPLILGLTVGLGGGILTLTGLSAIVHYRNCYHEDYAVIQ